LVIDPVLVYSTFLGGGNNDYAGSITIDTAGNAYVAGTTASSNFPTTPGAYEATYNGGVEDAFVTKLDPSGGTLIYSTFLGGSNTDVGQGLAIDSAGSAYVTGYTYSANFPTTLGAYDVTWGNSQDGFVTKLDPTGATLLYSTFLGGSRDEQGTKMEVDNAGNA